MDNQRRRLKILRILVRRPLLVHGAVVVGRAFELPVVKPEFFCSAPGGFGVEHAVVGHDALEAVGVPQDPVAHVSTVAGAQRALPGLINKTIMLLGVVEALHQVFKRSAAPVAVDGVDELLSVASRAVEVDHQDHVSVGGEEFGIPAVAPVISPCALRPAVDKELHGIFLAGIKVRRFDEKSFDPVSVGAGERERLTVRHANLREQLVVDVAKWPILVQ